MVLVKPVECSLGCWKFDYNNAFLSAFVNADVTEDVYVKMAPGW